jgi:hypothetical protein
MFLFGVNTPGTLLAPVNYFVALPFGSDNGGNLVAGQGEE